MARFYPPEPLTRYASELAVRAALTPLNEKWRVFHSVAWQSERYGRQGDGEADFVLLHPHHGLIVLEVKGGRRIDVDEGRWFSINSRTGERVSIKNPFDQARVSKYALLRYLQGISPSLAQIPIIHGVVFPGASHTGQIGPYGPRDTVIDADDLLDMERALDRLVSHWGQSTRMVSDEVEEITRRLAPTTTIRRRLRTVVTATRSELLKLTEQQSLAFHITRTRRRAAVSGGPGTGKTVLALERARYLANDGFQVLLTCFNRPLADELARATSDTSVRVATFHSLCMQQGRQAGIDVRIEHFDGSPERAADFLVDAAGDNGFAVEAVIVDEGQDFAPTWIQALRMLLTDPDQGIFYMFFDPRQALMASGWELAPDLETFPLDWNCRNTLGIAEKVCRIYGDDVLALGAEGPRPQWIRADSLDTGLRAIQELVDRLLQDEKLTPDQIVVLSDSRPAVDRLQRMVVSDASFVAIGGAGVVAETIHRFKGLEADVLLLLLVGESWSDEDLRSLAYVGMSRACAVLTVIGPKRLRRVVRWDD